jgi:D-sedoheptulose 7-phosphate isomerase
MRMPSEANNEFLRDYRARLVEILDGVDLDAVARAVDVIFDAWNRRALVLIAGNGGSASTASHCANDLAKATRVADRLPMRAVSITDNASLMTALANDDGFERVFSHQMETLFRPGDVLIAISASGNSPNIVDAAQHALDNDGRVIALTGFGGGKLADIADVTVHAPTEHGEYGPVEDVHLIVNHMITGCLLDRIRESDGTAQHANGRAGVPQ